MVATAVYLELQVAVLSFYESEQIAWLLLRLRSLLSSCRCRCHFVRLDQESRSGTCGVWRSHNVKLTAVDWDDHPDKCSPEMASHRLSSSQFGNPWNLGPVRYVRTMIRWALKRSNARSAHQTSQRSLCFTWCTNQICSLRGNGWTDAHFSAKNVMFTVRFYAWESFFIDRRVTTF